ncbi:4'-phosphopantetheinyl transferase family protein [Methylocaldum szegediense]|uniref:4'-phosphopantetheinyl transferase family protein n=1 Tax=Methylocaldum szegediense TaxID=73780 RepID=UPI00042692BB|nr:4'-phosphopantetheinyl transferase superfamily protein [Methylocaldum szegediense]
MPGILNFSAEVPQLSPGEVHVWCAPLAPDRNGIASRSTVFCESHSWNLADLSEDERERAGRFVSEKDRVRYVATRSILRRLLGAYLNLAPSEIRFSYGAFGKPELRSPSVDSALAGRCASHFAPGEMVTGRLAERLRFNLSHAGGWAAYAISCDSEVGIDIEPVRNDVPWQDLAPLVFSPNERAEFDRIPPCEKTAAFLRGWTRKEAYVKGRGEGLSLSLNSFDVPLGPLKTPYQVRSGFSSTAVADEWWLYPIDLAEGCIGTVAAEGRLARIKVYQLSGAQFGDIQDSPKTESVPGSIARSPVQLSSTVVLATRSARNLAACCVGSVWDPTTFSRQDI